MATELSYEPKTHVKLGLWSIKQKIYYATGYKPIKTWQNNTALNFIFAENLTPAEIQKIDNIVNHPNAQGPDVSLQLQNNCYIMRDIWVYRDEIATEAGFDFSIWFRSSGIFGSNVLDEIVIIPTDPTHTMQRILTNPQKNNLVNAIKSCDRWE